MIQSIMMIALNMFTKTWQEVNFSFMEVTLNKLVKLESDEQELKTLQIVEQFIFGVTIKVNFVLKKTCLFEKVLRTVLSIDVLLRNWF